MTPMNQSDFMIDIPATRVRLAPGARTEARSEVMRLGAKRALVLSTPHQQIFAEELEASLGEIGVGVFGEAAMHTPVEVTEKAMEAVSSTKADCIVAIGGGSTVGLGKAIAYRTDLPQIVIPTTYAGSEATPILGQTEDGVKTTVTDPSIRPEVIIYDPELTTSLPVGMTVTSGLNAMAHAVEALYARDANPLSSAMAAQGLEAFVHGLPRVVAAPIDLDARGSTLYGAWLCGSVLGQVGMALHHKLCHTLGGSFGLPHAETHAIVLAHATAYNAAAAGDLLRPVTEALGGASPGQALYKFAKDLGAPLALKDLGLSQSDLDRAADIAVTKPYWNPQPIEKTAIRSLLQSAWEGSPPQH